MSDQQPGYYVPEKSTWPLLGAAGLFCSVWGIASLLHHASYALWLLGAGTLMMVGMMVGWFHLIIQESQAGLYNPQMDRSFRWGMAWFIFSECMFFAAFFGVLIYARLLAVPWLGGIGLKLSTHTLLWPSFQATWPLLVNPDPSQFIGPKTGLSALGLPAINTLILLCSGVTVTFAHLALKRDQRAKLIVSLVMTIMLGLIFLSLQAYEYHHAYTELGLKLNSGIYGATFFMLTGFHGLHVSIGTLMLMIICLRCMKGHFSPEHHFGFEAVAWYWHFVDVVWLMLFVFVYWV